MDRRDFMKSAGTMIAGGALGKELLGQAPPATEAPGRQQRYVICEAYPSGLAARQVEKRTNPLYDHLAYTWGSNYPTRPTPEYLMASRSPVQFAHYDIAMAQKIGIDAFCFGDISYGVGTQFTDVFWAYWKALKTNQAFKLVPFTLMLNKGASDALRWKRSEDTWKILTKDYRDVFLKIDGKYVVHSWTADPRADTLTSDKELDGILEDLGGPEKVYFIQQTTYLANLTPVDGFDGGQYATPVVKTLKEKIRKYANGVTQFQAESYGDLPAFSRALAGLAKELGKELIYPVMAAFYQSRWQFGKDEWPGGRIHEKLGFAGYYYQWRNAIDSNARIVYITTWNDVTEDHSIMPEELHGYAYYELTRYFISWFKAGKRPPVEKEKILLFHHPQLTEKPLQVPPGALTVGRYGNSATPPADYIGVVVMVKKPTTVSVELGVSSSGIPNTQIAVRDFPSGVHFWLIYHPLANGNQSAIHNLDSNPKYNHNLDSNPKYNKDAHPIYPQERDDFFVTTLPEGFEDREVFVNVQREGRNIGYFTSHLPIAGAAASGNLGTVGDVFDLG